MKKFWLKIEWGAIFVLIPLLMLLFPHAMTPVQVLLGVLAYIFYLYTRHAKLRKKPIFVFSFSHHRLLGEIYNRLVISIILLSLIILIYDDSLLFNLLINKPDLWVLLLVIYPIFSVFPQEIIYRSFFFARYKKIFRHSRLIWMSALSFSFAHIIFLNFFAVFFTFVGGLFFALSYGRTRSLFLVVAEHSIYGIFLYTIGYGEFFIYERF